MSAYIESLRVVDPPTSADVEVQAQAKFSRNSDGIMELICMPQTEPGVTTLHAEGGKKVSMHVYNMLRSHDDGQLIRGTLIEAGIELDGNAVTVSTEHDGDLPATMTLVNVRH